MHKTLIFSLTGLLSLSPILADSPYIPSTATPHTIPHTPLEARILPYAKIWQLQQQSQHTPQTQSTITVYIIAQEHFQKALTLEGKEVSYIEPHLARVQAQIYKTLDILVNINHTHLIIGEGLPPGAYNPYAHITPDQLKIIKAEKQEHIHDLTQVDYLTKVFQLNPLTLSYQFFSQNNPRVAVYGINDASLRTQGFTLDREYLDLDRTGASDERAQRRRQDISHEGDRINKMRSQLSVREGFTTVNQLFETGKLPNRDHIHIIGLGHVNEMAHIYTNIPCTVYLIIPSASKYLK